MHTDRGSQFTSSQYKKALKNLGITHSMSRAGKCIDNGPMEGFFGTIKVEKYYLNKYTTLDDLKNDIKEYIRFYNEERLQKNLGNRSPLEYRKFKEKMSIIELSTWQGTDQMSIPIIEFPKFISPLKLINCATNTTKPQSSKTLSCSKNFSILIPPLLVST